MASNKRKRLYKTLILYVVLVALAVLFIFPLAWMVSTSLKPDDQVFLVPPKWIPNPIMWENYPKALRYLSFWSHLRNSCIITFIPMIGELLSASLVAYSFARLRWPGRDLLFLICLSTMMLPAQVTMIPTFVLFHKLGWVETLLPLVVPAFFGGGAFNIFLLRQFFVTLPMELSDAARVDGCNELGIFFRIMLPLAKPALMVVAIFSFIWHWNDFMGPLIYVIKTEELYPLSLGLFRFTGPYGQTQFSYLMAASTVVLLPALLLFIFAQQYFTEGIALSGLKG